MADGTVLPMQFGYTAPDEQAVSSVLEERGELYLSALERLRGCAEYHLRATQDQDVLLWDILRSTPQARLLNDRIRAGDADPGFPCSWENWSPRRYANGRRSSPPVWSGH